MTTSILLAIIFVTISRLGAGLSSHPHSIVKIVIVRCGFGGAALGSLALTQTNIVSCRLIDLLIVFLIISSPMIIAHLQLSLGGEACITMHSLSNTFDIVLVLRVQAA